MMARMGNILFNQMAVFTPFCWCLQALISLIYTSFGLSYDNQSLHISGFAGVNMEGKAS